MTHPIFSRIPFLGKLVDERFLEHRRRSTSIAGIVGGLIAVVFFEYRLIHDRRIDWGMFVVLVAMAGTKIAMMLWYRFND